VITFDEFLVVMAQRLRDAQQESKLIAAFKFFDKDNSGYITAEELKTVLDGMGEKLTKSEIEEVIRLADVDGDHTINYQEFVKFIMQSPSGLEGLFHREKKEKVNPALHAMNIKLLQKLPPVSKPRY
jgi:Ca2+-binding EF-hand superfamily protein